MHKFDQCNKRLIEYFGIGCRRWCWAIFPPQFIVHHQRFTVRPDFARSYLRSRAHHATADALVGHGNVRQISQPLNSPWEPGNSRTTAGELKLEIPLNHGNHCLTAQDLFFMKTSLLEPVQQDQCGSKCSWDFCLSGKQRLAYCLAIYKQNVSGFGGFSCFHHEL